MNNLHTKLNEYSSKCDEMLLSQYLKNILAEAMSEISEISANGLIINENMVLVDVREPEEFASGYIDAPNILTIPRGKLEFMAIDKIAKVYGQDIKIVTYCLKGTRGILAGLQLKKIGFTNVVNLQGGILGWLESGKSIKSYLGELQLKL